MLDLSTVSLKISVYILHLFLKVVYYFHAALIRSLLLFEVPCQIILVVTLGIRLVLNLGFILKQFEVSITFFGN